MRRTADGQITVFFSLIMMCMFAFFCVILESARTAGAACICRRQLHQRWILYSVSIIESFGTLTGFCLQSMILRKILQMPLADLFFHIWKWKLVSDSVYRGADRGNYKSNGRTGGLF